MTTNTDIDRELLSPAIVAGMLSISARTLWRMVQQGQFPAPVRFNRRLVRWPRQDVEAWLASLPTAQERMRP